MISRSRFLLLPMVVFLVRLGIAIHFNVMHICFPIAAGLALDGLTLNPFEVTFAEGETYPRLLSAQHLARVVGMGEICKVEVQLTHEK